MKWLYIILGVLVGVPLLVYVTGSLLPQSHTASLSHTYAADGSEIWSAVTGIERYPEWREEVSRVEMLSGPGEPLRWREFYTNNDPLIFEEVSRSDSSEFVTRIADENLPFGGRWTYRIVQEEGEARLSITEEGEVYNPFFRFISRFIMGHTGTIEAYLDHLDRKLAG